MVIAAMLKPEQICEKLAAWAAAVGIESRAGAVGALVTTKSDLLMRMIYADEKLSVTKCPVHRGLWSGMHLGWPGTFAAAYAEKDSVVAEVDPILQVWYDEGCRCFQHKGSQATTGWQPDEACGCVDPKRDAEEVQVREEIEEVLAHHGRKAETRSVGAAMDEKALVMERRKREEGG